MLSLNLGVAVLEVKIAESPRPCPRGPMDCPRPKPAVNLARFGENWSRIG